MGIDSKSNCSQMMLPYKGNVTWDHSEGRVVNEAVVDCGDPCGIGADLPR